MCQLRQRGSGSFPIIPQPTPRSSYSEPIATEQLFQQHPISCALTCIRSTSTWRESISVSIRARVNPRILLSRTTDALKSIRGLGMTHIQDKPIESKENKWYNQFCNRLLIITKWEEKQACLDEAENPVHGIERRDSAVRVWYIKWFIVLNLNLDPKCLRA